MPEQKFKKPPRQTAVAITYDKNENAPVIVAKGKGIIAENIINKAKESGVKTFQDENLVEELVKSDISDQIPEELYFAVASVLVYINNLDRAYSKKLQKPVYQKKEIISDKKEVK